MDIRSIKVKKQWKMILPTGYRNHGVPIGNEEMELVKDTELFSVVTQSDFLKEYYPSGHVINDPNVYPDIYKMEEEPIVNERGEQTGTKKVYYKELLPRYSFAFQQIITTKQLVHLCGNDIQFDLNDAEEYVNSMDHKNFVSFKTGWQDKDMEIAFYNIAKSTKITGDAAFIGYMKNGSFGFKTVSYLDGSTLYPHYNSITGELELFARSYYDYDSEGNTVAEWIEVWDNKHLTRLKKDKSNNVISFLKGIVGLEGYKMISCEPHNFPFIPVAYNRDEGGACWSSSQDAIESYELSFSQMAQYNQAFGFPILYLQGDDESAMSTQHDMNGSIKIITGSSTDKASFLNQQDASDSFKKQLDTLYKMIYEQSFCVIPPELRSGDLPAAALKILYSPAYEKAMIDASEYQKVLDDMVKIFSYGYGVETENTLGLSNLKMKWWIKPYVHVNTSAVVNDLATAVQNGFLSKKTASDRISEYSVADEYDRIILELKEENQHDILLNQVNESDND